ncbi:MAG: aminoacyl-tRNA hydrolase [Candidatus Falkowbacteria bacterium]
MSYDLRLIVGLGNPGEKYKNTRHNAGFMVLDALAEQENLSWKLNKRFNTEISDSEENTILIKPQTFMNNSGQAVQAVLNYYKLLPKTLGVVRKKNIDLSDKIIIIHDDVDIELGKFKIQSNRSTGGHNGIKSIINHLKTQNFTRVRIGIANSLLRAKIAPEKFVLQNFPVSEKNTLDKLIPEILQKLKER